MTEHPHAERRARLLAQAEGALVAVRGAGAEGVNPNFYYLTGVDAPDGLLLMAEQGIRIGTGRKHPGPDYVRGRLARSVLFLPSADPLAAKWGEDAAATAASVSPDELGVDAVLPLADHQDILVAALRSANAFAYVRGFAPGLSPHGNGDSGLVERVRRNWFGLQLCDLTPAVEAQRTAKDTAEVAAISRAGRLTGEALARVMGMASPGVAECEIEAEITRTYRAAGGGHAFDPIVGSGANALLLHYKTNHGRLKDGDLLLLDTGAKLGGYCADVTRTVPVSGRFTDRQREVYEVVLGAQEAAIAACTPGSTLGQIHAVAWRTIEAAGLAEFFIHGTSHHLGLETHDAGNVHAPLPEGAVVTVEPGVYIPDETIGIRIEDDVLIGPDGPQVLTGEIPKTPDDVENAVKP